MFAEETATPAAPELVCPGCPQEFKSREQWTAHTRNHAHARVGQYRSRGEIREEMRQERSAS